MRQVFRNAEHQAAFDRDGFVVMPFLDNEEVASLTARYDQLPAVNQSGFFSGIYSENEDFKRGCHELLSGVARKFAAEHLVDYRLLVGNFVLKMPEGESVMPMHQDWTMVDESRFASLNLWFALTDTNEANGAMHVLRGSHRLEGSARGTLMPPPFSYNGQIPYSELCDLPMKTGQVLVHDHRTLHCSPPNRTQQRRLATAIAMVPQEAQAIHYFRNPETGRVEAYEIDTDFFMKYTFGANHIPEGTRFLRYEDDFQPVHFSKQEIDALKERQSSAA